MEYCLGPGDGSATMWTAAADTDLDGDGRLDAVRLDFDGDGLIDDVMADLDGDGLADHAVLDADNDGSPEAYFTDDGSGTWAVTVDRPPQAGGAPTGQLRWFGLDGIEHAGGSLVDLDGDGQAGDGLTDTDGDGLADRAVSADGAVGYVDGDRDGRWDVKLADTDGDGTADTANTL
jgi:hypothetical protein